MKKVLFFVMTLVASAFIVPNAFAASEPVYGVISGENVLIANGTAITIEANGTEGGAKVLYGDGEEIIVASDTWIFGGTHNDDSTTVDTSIIMNGGEVAGIFGGGLHKSKVGEAYIEVNGGKVGQVDGGGVASGFFKSVSEEEKAHIYDGDATESTTRVESATVIINDGTIVSAKGYGLVFGGGMGYNYVGSASVIINGGDLSAAWVTAGGSHGYTGTASVAINGGTVNVVQGVNRGEIEEIGIIISGGEITSVYAGGETTDKNVTGTFGESTVMLTENIVGDGAVIGSISTGTNGGKTEDAVATTKLAYEEELYSEDLFVNSGFATENITTTVELTFVGVIEGTEESFPLSVSIPKGTVFAQEDIDELLAAANEGIEDSGLVFKGFFADEAAKVEFDFTEAIDDDTVVYMVYGEEEEVAETPTVENPETSDINIVALALVLLIGGTGLAFTLKNRKFN